MGMLDDNELVRLSSITSHRLARDLNHDLVRGLTWAAVLATRLSMSEEQMFSDEEHIKKLEVKVEVHKSRSITAAEEREVAVVEREVAEEEKMKLTSEMTEMKERFEAEKAMLKKKISKLSTRCQQVGEAVATAIEDYQKSKAFQDNLEPVFL